MYVAICVRDRGIGLHEAASKNCAAGMIHAADVVSSTVADPGLAAAQRVESILEGLSSRRIIAVAVHALAAPGDAGDTRARDLTRAARDDAITVDVARRVVVCYRMPVGDDLAALFDGGVAQAPIVGSSPGGMGTGDG